MSYSKELEEDCYHYIVEYGGDKRFTSEAALYYFNLVGACIKSYKTVDVKKTDEYKEALKRANKLTETQVWRDLYEDS